MVKLLSGENLSPPKIGVNEHRSDLLHYFPLAAQLLVELLAQGAGVACGGPPNLKAFQPVRPGGESRRESPYPFGEVTLQAFQADLELVPLRGQ